MTATDEELVAKSNGGDPDSFNELIRRWERPIYALAYRQIGREEDARDVCQETFLRAYRALKGFRGQSTSAETGLRTYPRLGPQSPVAPASAARFERRPYVDAVEARSVVVSAARRLIV